MDRTEIQPFRFWIKKKSCLKLKYADVYGYEIPFDQLKTTKEICKWLAQIRSKTWANDEILADLIRSIHELVNLYEI